MTQKEIESGELEPLNSEEIGIAKNRIEELHPMYSQPIHRILPYLCCCMRLRQRKISSKEYYQQMGEDDDPNIDKKLASERMTQQIKEYGGKEYVGQEPEFASCVKEKAN